MAPSRIGVVLLLICATSGFAAETSYNLGVEAWHKKDYQEAARQWSNSVLTGDIDAINNLAYLYFNGLGMERRVDDAIRLWRTAAYSGNSESQWHLGLAYEQGVGVAKNLMLAYAWYGCAVESASRLSATDKSGTELAIGSDAQSSLASLERLLNAAEITKAKSRDALVALRKQRLTNG